ncbi:MAG: hypothetical protein WBD10_09885 [Acidobacteriaceae bacterium]
MMLLRFQDFRILFLVGGLWMLLALPDSVFAQPSPAAVSAFSSYVREVQARLARRHQAAIGFLAPENDARLRRGDLVIEELTPSGGQALPGALLHDWRGTAFVPGATAADFVRLMEDFRDYPRLFSPQVLRAQVLAQDGGHFRVKMRMRQHHVITVVLDATYDVAFARLDAGHGTSISRSTRIDEIGSPGAHDEHALPSGEAHGFLWRMNTYWSYEQRDGGLSIQVESISLTRSIPRGLGWAVGPFVESIPRQSLEFTLRSVRNALRKKREEVGK